MLRKFSVVVVLTGILVASCAERESGIRAGEGQDPREASLVTTTSAEEPGSTVKTDPPGVGERTTSPRSTLPPAPSSAPRDMSPPTNKNLKSTPMGVVCWTSIELGLSIVSGLEYIATVDTHAGEEIESKRRSVDKVKAVLEPAPDELRSTLAKLPTAAKPFTERLISDTERTKAFLASSEGEDVRVRHEQLLRSLDLEGYPSVAEFGAAARDDPGCVTFHDQ